MDRRCQPFSRSLRVQHTQQKNQEPHHISTMMRIITSSTTAITVLVGVFLLLFVIHDAAAYNNNEGGANNQLRRSRRRSQCGQPTDLCMNEDNWNYCRMLEEEQDCERILVMESCPLQFACGDENDEDNDNEYDEDNENDANNDQQRVDILIEEQEQPKQEKVDSTTSSSSGGVVSTPDSCVSIFAFQDEQCTGSPLRTLTFPTWHEPGSPCYHDATMVGYSVSDQYCNLDTGNWQETLYAKTDTCEVVSKQHSSWSSSWSWESSSTTTNHNNVYDFTFTKKDCIFGYKLHFCQLGPCPGEDDIPDDVVATTSKQVME